jgi:hypothetical protein
MESTKNRHGFLTALLVLMIIANSVIFLRYLYRIGSINQTLPNMTGWAIPVHIVLSLCNLVCLIALFHWKKWGFWGLCASSVVTLVVNLSVGVRISQALVGLGGVLMLYGVFHIGKENKGWPQLSLEVSMVNFALQLHVRHPFTSLAGLILSVSTIYLYFRLRKKYYDAKGHLPGFNQQMSSLRAGFISMIVYLAFFAGIIRIDRAF